MRCKEKKSGRQDSNLRPSAWKADALPTELRPLIFLIYLQICEHQNKSNSLLLIKNNSLICCF